MDNVQNVSPVPVDGNSLRLRPRVAEHISKFLGAGPQLQEMVRACGSPLSVLFPERTAGNAAEFCKVFAETGITGKIFYAHKANQSTCVPRYLATQNVGIDVASAEELRHALSCGFTGQRIEATGPKNTEFLGLLLLHGTTINVDSVAELESILALRNQLPPKSAATPVLLRMTGLEAAHSPVLLKASRFGIRLSDSQAALELCAKNQAAVKLLGFAFHLDTVSSHERVVGIEQCLGLFDRAIELGLEPRVLNIGGGFKVSYLQFEEDWNNFTSALRESVLGTRPPMTWQNATFGLSVDGGTLKGNFNSYGFFEKTPGAKFLREVLDGEVTAYGGKTVATLLQENMIELWIEPGRSLLDGIGITVARVNFCKTSSQGHNIIGLNMKRQDLAFLDQEVFVDPLVISKNQPAGDAPYSHPVFFAGNLCLESDMITRRQVRLQKLPEPGDLVVFINTAAYMMDFSATTSIMQPPARRIAVCETVDGFVWMLDEQYSPLWRQV